MSGEGSLGRIRQGFGQWLMKFHWLGFSPDLGFSQINICVYVYDLLLGSLSLFRSVNIYYFYGKFLTTSMGAMASEGCFYCHGFIWLGEWRDLTADQQSDMLDLNCQR